MAPSPPDQYNLKNELLIGTVVKLYGLIGPALRVLTFIGADEVVPSLFVGFTITS